MSALGQKRTLELSRAMSALCQKRTRAVQQKHLFDHLVGARFCRIVTLGYLRERAGQAQLRGWGLCVILLTVTSTMFKLPLLANSQSGPGVKMMRLPSVLYVATTLAHRLDRANHALIELKNQLLTGEPHGVVARTVSKMEGLLSVGWATGRPSDEFIDD